MTLQTNSPFGASPPICILGVLFDFVTMRETLDRIDAMVASRKPHYMATANVDFLVQAREDVELRRILGEADLVVCDGTPVLWSAKWLGAPLPERVAGSDLAPLLLKRAEQKGHRIFFLGASPEAGKQAAARLASEYPNLQLVGIYSPPYQPLLEMDHEDIARRIREARPDILMVCFGCPKQEKWIAMHYQRLGIPVSIGVGGTLDFLAGRLRRAPQWMRSAGLEWIFRLAQEPRRLFRRYVKDLAVFGSSFVQQWLSLRSRAGNQRAVELCSAQGAGTAAILCVRGNLNKQAARDLYAQGLEALRNERSLVVDLSETKTIDSVGAGALLRLHGLFARAGLAFVCAKPAGAVSKALRILRIDEVLCQTQTLDAALQLTQAHVPDARVQMARDAEVCRLAWHGEVTAANANEIWDKTREKLVSHGHSRWLLELHSVPFMDSSGLSLLVRLRNFAGEARADVRFTGAQRNVLNAVRLAKLEGLFAEHPPSRIPAAQEHPLSNDRSAAIATGTADSPGLPTASASQTPASSPAVAPSAARV